MAEQHTPLHKDKTWLALMEALAALTSMLRNAGGEHYMDSYDAQVAVVRAIKAIMTAMDDYNLG